MREALRLFVAALAAYRTWRLIGYDDITEPLRAPLERRAEERGGVWEEAWNGLTCPWCLGSWIAFVAAFTSRRTRRFDGPLEALAVAAVVGWLGNKVEE